MKPQRVLLLLAVMAFLFPQCQPDSDQASPQQLSTSGNLEVTVSSDLRGPTPGVPALVALAALANPAAALDTSPQDESAAPDLRERLLHTMLVGFNEAGLFDQAVEFHNLAVKRWGKIQDATLARLVAAEIATAKSIVQGGAVQMIENREGSQRGVGCSVELGNSIVINYRMLDVQATLSVDVFAGITPTHPSEAEFNLVIEHEAVLGGPLGVSVSTFTLPVEASGSDSANGWNAVRIHYKQAVGRESATLSGWLVFYINGQRIVDASIGRYWYDESEGALARWDDSMIPIIVGFNGDGRVAVRVTPR